MADGRTHASLHFCRACQSVYIDPPLSGPRMPCVPALRLHPAYHPALLTHYPATDHITSYLNDRLSHGEPLHGGSAAVAPYYIYKTNRGGGATAPRESCRRSGLAGSSATRFGRAFSGGHTYCDTALTRSCSSPNPRARWPTTFASSSCGTRVRWSLDIPPTICCLRC